MKKLSEKGRRILRTVYRVLGVTAISLIFQACYGMPPDMGDNVTIHGSVKSKKTNAPIPGIRVSVEDTSFNRLTSNSGNFYIYLPRQGYYTVIFSDIDGPENGGLFKQHTVNLTAEECEALAESPLLIELEDEDSE